MSTKLEKDIKKYEKKNFTLDGTKYGYNLTFKSNLDNSNSSITKKFILDTLNLTDNYSIFVKSIRVIVLKGSFYGIKCLNDTFTLNSVSINKNLSDDLCILGDKKLECIVYTDIVLHTMYPKKLVVQTKSKSIWKLFNFFL